jgi:ABC-2 type transport system ATP-binding protein
MEYVVEISNLSKDYETGFWRKKKVRALDDLTLNVRGGQIFGFLGGNGAGKTTTIKILMGLLFPTGGSATILGKEISEVDMHRDIGYCPENPYFYDYLTARELMHYFGEIFGMDKTKRASIAEELLSMVGLDGKSWDRQLRKFSKGMLQRVGLAQSLINDPKIIFLDEPMSGLDPVGRREIRELIASLREEGKTVFMSTHILSDIEALCDEVAILRNGKLAATGKLDDLLFKSGEERVFEINLNGVSESDVVSRLNGLRPISITEKASGISLHTNTESDIDAILKACREAGGRLISVQPVKQSLEEFFVKENTDQG